MRLEDEISCFSQNIYFAVYFDARDGGITPPSPDLRRCLL